MNPIEHTWDLLVSLIGRAYDAIASIFSALAWLYLAGAIVVQCIGIAAFARMLVDGGATVSNVLQLLMLQALLIIVYLLLLVAAWRRRAHSGR